MTADDTLVTMDVGRILLRDITLFAGNGGGRNCLTTQFGIDVAITSR